MERGAILPPVSIAALPPAAPAGTPQRSIAVITIPLARGANTVIRSTDVQKPVRPVARLPMIMQITAIPTVRGFRTAKRSISVPRRARPAETPVMSMPTMWILTATANATIAARPSP